MCPRGIEQMRADADEAARKFSANNIVAPVAVLCQAMACILSGDPDSGDKLLEDVVSVAEEVGAHEVEADALDEQALLAMAGGDWSRAELWLTWPEPGH
jgi:hypothetical protein